MACWLVSAIMRRRGLFQKLIRDCSIFEGNLVPGLQPLGKGFKDNGLLSFGNGMQKKTRINANTAFFAVSQDILQKRFCDAPSGTHKVMISKIFGFLPDQSNGIFRLNK